MSEKREKSGWQIAVALVLAVVLIPLGCYIGGYFVRSYETFGDGVTVVRYYRATREAAFFWPAVRADSLLTGRKVSTSGPFMFGVSTNDDAGVTGVLVGSD